MNFDVVLNSNSVLFLLLGLILSILLVIFLFRIYFFKKSVSNLAAKYSNKQWDSPLQSRSKYPDVDVFGMSGAFFRFGLAISLALILFAFSWTSYEKEVIIPDDALVMDVEIEIEPPRTAEPPPPPPPPPPPIIQEVPNEVILEEDEPIFLDQDIEEKTIIDVPEVVEDIVEAAPPPPPPPPPPPEEEVEEIFRVVEQMPRFPGCENMSGSNQEKDECSKTKLLEYIYANLKYPPIARDNGIDGTTVIQFVVDREGMVTDVNIVRDIGAGCGESAKKVVESMNNMPERWIPGKQRGRPVKVLYTLPVRFQLLSK